MEAAEIPYKRQIFVCVHDLKGESPSCGAQGGETIFRELRRIARDRYLHPTIRVAQSKCLGQCGKGCNVMIFPENIFLKGVTVEDVSQIADQYLPEAKDNNP